MRMVARVHSGASNARSTPSVPTTTGFTQLDVLVIKIPNLANGGAAFAKHQPHLTRWESKQGISLFMSHHLSNRTGAADHLCPATRPQLQIVDKGTRWQLLNL